MSDLKEAFPQFFEFLKQTDQKILQYLDQNRDLVFFGPEDIHQGAWSYIHQPAKRLRPSILLMACGCVGGDEATALPAAAAVEVFHTWTLVHDDLIDNDSLRRKAPTVHVAAREKAKKERGLSEKLARDYGRDIAILAGDVQHGWSVVLLSQCGLREGADPRVTLELINYLQSYVLGKLICGQALDVQFSLMKPEELFQMKEDEILHMLWLKTGVLYEFSAMAGAMIGQNTTDRSNEQVMALKNFAGHCGTAFQLQDDILGITAKEEVLGKPIGSDIQEGKKTLIVYQSLKQASPAQRKKILATLGNQKASQEEIKEVISLLKELGGVEYTKNLAHSYLEKARVHLDVIPPSNHKDLLRSWADFMIHREF